MAPNTIESTRRRRILAIDDEPSMVDWLRVVLQGQGYEVRTALVAARGAEIFGEWQPDVVISDVTLPDLDGISLVRRMKRLDPRAAMIVMSGEGSLARAVEAGQAGALHFLQKPLGQDGLIDAIRMALESVQAMSGRGAPAAGEQDRAWSGVIGRSQRMKELLDLVESVASSDANILIQGENGTGKELIANAIHARSNRATGPFIKINCAAIPRELIESELFGYKKGAFTGASTDKVGLLEMAGRGSLLLDEIGEMPSFLQTKLLRVLQEREYRPIGSDRLVRVDFRLICATNVDLDAALRQKTLREDLYFRINTITLRVPALRDRSEDIPQLCDFFLATFNERHRKSVEAVGRDALALLLRHQWPGNVRELENAIERSVLVCRNGEIGPPDLPPSIGQPVDGSDVPVLPRRTLAEIERMVIVQTLRRTNWNKREAAQMLGLYRPTLYSKMRKHAIADERVRRGVMPGDPAGEAGRGVTTG